MYRSKSSPLCFLSDCFMLEGSEFWHRLNWDGTFQSRPENVIEGGETELHLQHLYSDASNLFQLIQGTWA